MIAMSPRTTEQLEAMRLSSREKIVIAALTLFARDGYHNTSVASIARHAGVAKGLIYNYFSSKEDLLSGIMDHGFGGMDEFKAMHRIADPREQLRFILDHFFNLIATEIEFIKLFTSLSIQWEQFSSGAIGMMAKEKYAAYQQIFEDILRRVNEPKPVEEARLLMALLDGIGIQYIALREDYPLEAVRTHLIQKYCNPIK
jgi:AcrR family transcriptional regulator